MLFQPNHFILLIQFQNKKKQTKFNDVCYLTQHISQILSFKYIINIKRLMSYFMGFSFSSTSKIQYVLYTYSTYQFVLATFQVFGRHIS